MLKSNDPGGFDSRRHAMVEQQLKARGIHSSAVLAAMNRVHRESFLPENMRALAYEDSPLPIAEGQSISQPYIVGYMIDALELQGGERMLEVGTGSGYAAAVLAEIARHVTSVERHKALADRARTVLNELGYGNVEVYEGDGSLGWAAGAPFDAILVSAASPTIPEPLKRQLVVGGRLVVPVGMTEARQRLVRVTRSSQDVFEEEELLDVHFVPLIGKAGWRQGSGRRPIPSPKPLSLPSLMAEQAEVIDHLDTVDLSPLLERIGDARVVCIGESSHGTREFYRLRARISRELIKRKGFKLIAVEADWPDAGRIDSYVRQRPLADTSWTAFSRFPTWMWRNREVKKFVDWLHDHNAGFTDGENQISFHGLDLYSMFTSIGAVLGYLESVDKTAARLARDRYACLLQWEGDPARYGRAVTYARYEECEEQVISMLRELLEKRMDYARRDGERFLDAIQNARLVANAERYYRSIYEGFSESWNLRDQHMFETLQELLDFRGPDSRAVVWAHNSHLGDASKTDMAVRGQLNLGQLCREAYADQVYLIGFGTDRGTVTAASEWGGPMETKSVRPSLEDSWERVAHDSGLPAFLLGMRDTRSSELKQGLKESRLERAIGVIYRPESERISHYFKARLGEQFDEYIWIDESHALEALSTKQQPGLPDTYPFGL